MQNKNINYIHFSYASSYQTKKNTEKGKKSETFKLKQSQIEHKHKN